MPNDSKHLPNCSCGDNLDQEITSQRSLNNESRRNFFKASGAIGLGLLAPPLLANSVSGTIYHQKEIEKNLAIRNGKAQRFTILAIHSI